MNPRPSPILRLTAVLGSCVLVGAPGFVRAASVVTSVAAAGSDATPSPASAPAVAASPQAAAVSTRVAAVDPDPLELDPAEPDFSVINLPTTLRAPRHKMAFRLTHRFARALGEGDFGDLLSDFFGFDRGAQVGFELRFGLTRGAQLGVQRTSDRTTEFFVQQALWREGPAPLGLALAVSVEGRDNFGADYSPRVALVASKRLGSRSALYVEPAFVGNTRLGPDQAGDDGTFVLGLGARVGLGAGVALVGELTPRLAGYKGRQDSATHATFGIEKRVGGHAFQLNFSNDLGTTPASVARGRQGRDDWFIGFNLSRKFF